MAHSTHRRLLMIVLVLDIETTGLSKSKHSITVIGTIVYESLDETTISEKCYNVALAEEAGANGKELITMKQEITKLLDDAGSVVAFNGINFDMPFILEWLNAAPRLALPLQPDLAVPTDPQTAEASVGNKRKTPLDDGPVQDLPELAKNDINTSKVDPWKHKYLDFCRISRDYTGCYISLNNVCLLNKIDVAKSGSGLQAIQWAQDKNWASLESYCMQDVVVLLALTKHALRDGIMLRLQAYGKRGKRCDNIVVFFDSAMQPFVQNEKGASGKDIFDTASPNALHFGT